MRGAPEPARAAAGHLARSELRRAPLLRRGNRSRTAARDQADRGGRLWAPRGMPMSTVWTSPAYALPGLIHSPGLAAWKVAVARRRGSLRPATTPVEASMPLWARRPRSRSRPPRVDRPRSGAPPHRARATRRRSPSPAARRPPRRHRRAPRARTARAPGPAAVRDSSAESPAKPLERTRRPRPETAVGLA